MLSIILPAFNEEKNIDYACEEIRKALYQTNIEYEIVFVDDGSRDNTWGQIEQLASENKNIRGVSFSRNFGKESAVIAGLSESKGACCVVMDCDMQHPPVVIPQMYELWKEGYDVVEGIKKSRGKESKIHKFAAGLFYKLVSSATAIDMSNASDFKLMDRKVVDSLLEMKEKSLFFRAASAWVGYKKKQVEFDVQERVSGETKWSTKSLIKYAVNNITSFTLFPLQVVSAVGILYLIFAVVMCIQTLYRYCTGNALEGFSSIIILILLTGSLLMLGMGILGYYVGKVYDEVRNRPRYIISKKINDEQKDSE